MYKYFSDRNMIPASLVSCVRGDVNGDRIPDNIYLTGIKTPDSPFIQNITLVIEDGRTGMYHNIRLESNEGYNPRLYLYDFTGNGIYDILISIDSGGSGGIMCYYIYSYVNNIPQLLFDFNVYNDEYQYDVIYRDNYKVQVISKKNNKSYIIDILYKGSEYQDEIYDKHGKLKEPISGFVSPLSGLFPLDLGGNYIFELLALQGISGRYHADGLGYMQNILRWGGNRFLLEEQFIGIFGNEV